MATVPAYILIASGSVTTPKLEIAVYQMDDAHADEQSRTIVATLHSAGYYQFSLFATPVDGEHHLVETYRVEQPKPVVTASRRADQRC